MCGVSEIRKGLWGRRTARGAVPGMTLPSTEAAHARCQLFFDLATSTKKPACDRTSRGHSILLELSYNEPIMTNHPGRGSFSPARSIRGFSGSFQFLVCLH